MHGDDSPEAHAWYTLPEALRSMGLPTSIKMLAVGDDDMAPFLHRGDLAIYDPRVRRIQSRPSSASTIVSWSAAYNADSKAMSV